METLGSKLRHRRRRLGWTLDDLFGRTGISKSYLSLIEAGRAANPPSDAKLRILENSLGFAAGELMGLAHLQRLPRDVRAILGRLLAQHGKCGGNGHAKVNGDAKDASVTTAAAVGVSLDEAFLSGILHELADSQAGNIEPVSTRPVPVINCVSAGYPRDFTDLSYPPRAADDYVGCPDLDDKDAFAARVHGDSMTPKYTQGDIVIFSPAAPVGGNGDDCFVRFDDGQTTFKRVFFETDEGGVDVVRLQPRNERYRPQIIPSQKISGLYRAIFKYMRVDGN